MLIFVFLVPDLDNSLPHTDSVGHSFIYLLPADYKGFHDIHTYVGKYRTAYIAHHNNGKSGNHYRVSKNADTF